jgi:hypothetical protein
MRVAYPARTARSSSAPETTCQDDRVSRQVRIALGVFLVVLGIFATVAGLAIVVLVGPDGSIGIRPTRLLSSGYAVTLPQLNVPRLPGDERLRLDVSLQPSGAPTFIGVGPTASVDTYLEHVSVDVIEQIDWPGAARTVATPGNAEPSRPRAQSFWVVSDEGDAPSLRWEAQPGDWTLVVMNEDGSRSVDVSIVGALTLPALGPIGFVMLAVAVVILGVGIWFTVRAAGR